MIGKIIDYDGERLLIEASFCDSDLLARKRIVECEVNLIDGRAITPRLNRAIHSTIRDIAAYISGFPEKDQVRAEVLRQLQLSYLIDATDSEAVRYSLTEHFCKLSEYEIFSLSAKKDNCASVTLASEFLSYLIDLCVENAIPCSSRLLDRAEDISRYLYACLANKRCCICGKPGEVHHHPAIGAGRNRREIVHLGMKAICLCRDHHMEAHTIGQSSFDEKYHTFAIELDEKLCKILKLNTERK